MTVLKKLNWSALVGAVLLGAFVAWVAGADPFSAAGRMRIAQGAVGGIIGFFFPTYKKQIEGILHIGPLSGQSAEEEPKV